MKKIFLILISFLSISIQASNFSYFISGINNERRGHDISIEDNLPSDFLVKEKPIERKFEIKEEIPNINGKYKVIFYPDPEYLPKKRKLVVSLSKLNQENGKFEGINDNFYFFEDDKFEFIGRFYLSPTYIIAIGVVHKKYWKKNN